MGKKNPKLRKPLSLYIYIYIYIYMRINVLFSSILFFLSSSFPPRLRSHLMLAAVAVGALQTRASSWTLPSASGRQDHSCAALENDTAWWRTQTASSSWEGPKWEISSSYTTSPVECGRSCPLCSRTGQSKCVR